MATVFLNTQIGAVEIKIPDIRILILVNTAVLNIKIDEAENKLFKVIVLFKKTYYDAQISDIQKKQFTTSDYNKFKSDMLDSKIRQKKN